MKSSNFINVLYGLRLECLPPWCISLIFVVTKLVVECCETKVQLEYVLHTWLGVWNNLSSCQMSVTVWVLLMANVKTELETSAAWSSCPFASLPQNSRAEVSVLLSITSCCCISSWLQRKSISCFFDGESSVAWWPCCAAPWVCPRPQKLFQYLREYFIWKLKCVVPKGPHEICICGTLLPLPAVLPCRWKQTEWLDGSWCS